MRFLCMCVNYYNFIISVGSCGYPQIIEKLNCSNTTGTPFLTKPVSFLHIPSPVPNPWQHYACFLKFCHFTHFYKWTNIENKRFIYLFISLFGCGRICIAACRLSLVVGAGLLFIVVWDFTEAVSFAPGAQALGASGSVVAAYGF